jgi:hypothetical protein
MYELSTDTLHTIALLALPPAPRPAFTPSQPYNRAFGLVPDIPSEVSFLLKCLLECFLARDLISSNAILFCVPGIGG